MEDFFSNPIFWGIVTVISLAVNFTDKIKTRWKILFYSIGIVCFCTLVYFAIDKPILLAVSISVAVCFLLFSIYVYRLRNKIAKTKEVSETKPETKIVKESKFKRFEDIKSGLKFGYITYKPFFWTDGKHPITYKGIGYDVLKEVLRPLSIDIANTKNYTHSNWSEIFDKLIN